jgi:hypothetical protein
MKGGIIRNNSVLGSGGGVHVDSGGIFSKTGGTIYGGNESPNALKNNTANNGGNAVNVASNTSAIPNRLAKERNNTAGPSVNLNSETIENWY